MPKNKRRGGASAARDYAVETEWSNADLALLNELIEAERLLPADAPRVLISVRLSVFTDETTSPARQELDLRLMAREKGYRVVGVASDLNVSATKVPPWKRKELGHWLKERVPEFDVLMFWKLDRFIRNLGDLSMMIRWAEKYEKNLVSKHDPIDLSTTVGKIMVTIIGGVAEIETANTTVRVKSLWDYNKTQDDWLIGKPPFGYETVTGADGVVRLEIYEPEAKVLRASRALLLRGKSVTAITKMFKERGMLPATVTTTTMIRRLRNPALMGYRVETDPDSGHNKRARIVFGRDGEPIRIAQPIFTQEQYDRLQAALDARVINRAAVSESPSRFLGIIKCSECGTNISVQRMVKKQVQYLRCTGCKSGGPGYPNPQAVYDRIAATILEHLGNEPVRTREYARGEEMRRKVEELQSKVAYYMTGLEPGGRFAKVEFMRLQAEDALAKLTEELAAIDESTTEDRWVYVAGGKTYREHWEEGGFESMASDLARVGVQIILKRTKEPGKRPVNVELEYRFPKDLRDRLVIREDDFTMEFSG